MSLRVRVEHADEAVNEQLPLQHPVEPLERLALSHVFAEHAAVGARGV